MRTKGILDGVEYLNAVRMSVLLASDNPPNPNKPNQTKPKKKQVVSLDMMV
jgi:hypothetical protein